MTHKDRLLQVVQPGLLGLTDGALSTLSPMFAAAFLSGSRAALLVGLAAAVGAAISMGISEGLSDDGVISGRGTARRRGLITAVATFIGGVAHTLPFLISNVDTALVVAYIMVGIELLVISYVRQRWLNVKFHVSLAQVFAAGVVISVTGIVIGHA